MEQPAASSGKVVINTLRGNVVITLHATEAPQQCSLFLDWVVSVKDLADVPCSQRVIKNFYIHFYLDEVEERRPPLPRLEGQRFNRPGLCAFSNHTTSHFIITLDPCDALDHKYSIFGEVAQSSFDTLHAINNLESDDEIPEDCFLITGIQILEPMPGYTPSPVPPPSPSLSYSTMGVLDSSSTVAFPIPSSEDIKTFNMDADGVPPDPATPIVSPDSSLDTSFDTPISSTPPTSSTPPCTTSTTTTITSSSSTITTTANNFDANNTSNNNNTLNSSILLNRSKTKSSISNFPPPTSPSSSISRRSSITFQVPSPKRQRVESPQPKSTPMARSSTLILDQQQCLMASHFGSTINSGDLLASSHHPRVARSFSAPDIRLRFQPKWPKRLVIVRHGQSEQNACLDLYQEDIDTLLALAAVRDCDIKLTEFGKWQAEQTGKFLAKSDQFDICFVSPAVNTAELIAKELPYKLKIYKDNWLREKEFGRLHGLNEKTVREKFPFEYEIRNRDGKYWYRFPGGENYCDVEMRIHCFLEKLSRDYAGRSVMVVTHQVPYKLFRALLQHLDEDGVLKLEAVHNCGVQEYLLDRTKSQGGRLKLKTFNHTAYNVKECPPHLVAKSTTRNND